MANTKGTKENTTTKKKPTRKKKAQIPKTVEISKLKKQEKEIINKQEQDNNKTLTVLGIIILAVIAIIIFGLTYAYFSATIKKTNPDITNVDINTADLLVRYQDGDSNIKLGEKIEPGDVITKEFSIINEGNDTGIYTIALESIKHNLGHIEVEEEKKVLKSDISYKLIKISTINNVDNETIIGTGTLPFESGVNDQSFIVYTKDEVLVNTTNKYRLELTYVNHTHIDQSDSMGESLELKVNIINYEGEKRTESTEN